MNLIKAIYWHLYIVRLAIRWIPRPNIGDRVWYLGRQWTLIQGVRDPLWSLADGDDRVEAHKAEFSKVRTVKNWLGSFRSGYRFYMRIWYSIWMREGIKPWMIGCNIWAGRPPTETREGGSGE